MRKFIFIVHILFSVTFRRNAWCTLALGVRHHFLYNHAGQERAENVNRNISEEIFSVHLASKSVSQKAKTNRTRTVKMKTTMKRMFAHSNYQISAAKMSSYDQNSIRVIWPALYKYPAWISVNLAQGLKSATIGTIVRVEKLSLYLQERVYVFFPRCLNKILE